MIFYILDAYEESVGKYDSLLKRVKKMNILTHICMSIIVLLYIGIIAAHFIWKDAMLTIVCMAVYVIISQILMLVINKQRRKNYINNVNEYHKKLDQLKDLLSMKEFRIDSENKMKKLLEKIQNYISEKEEETLERKKSNHEFSNTILIPIATFTVGAFVSEFVMKEVVPLAMVFLVLIIVFRFTYISLIELENDIFKSKVIRMRCLYNEIQDLYDRDYLV